MVYRIFVEKKREFANEAKALLNDINKLLDITEVKDLRIVNRYDVEDIHEQTFEKAVKNILSEPQVDLTYKALEQGEGERLFAVEYLPGQFDQRANSASECIQLMTGGLRPEVKSAKLYILKGNIDDSQLEAIKAYVINPVEAREATLLEYETLKQEYDTPETVKILEGFRALDEQGLRTVLDELGLAMDLADLKMCQDYFKEEDRDPSLTEIKVIDTYWSDHCRHTTFNTIIDSIEFEDELVKAEYEKYLKLRAEVNRTKPVTLMDMGTIAARVLKHRGILTTLDESDEINACTVNLKVEFEGSKEQEDWLLLFKNETHNHPTEIEPFGGAATCIGGAIRDPLSGRSYVYSAMRVTGAGNPLKPLGETLEGKLPQRKLVTTAANGYSSYGNQIGLATGLVDELYHPGYEAKRMEIGAVIAAAPKENVRRQAPEPGDKIILLGGKTGRDGCGGATGSSKSHTLDSLSECGAEVQKGNAPEERKLQRLFRNKKAAQLIKKCNDFGAGGVSVAIGELADGLDVNLDLVPKKYQGLDGTELAISESQERMAVVVDASQVEAFIELAKEENLEATEVATVNNQRTLNLYWRGEKIVSIKRDFLDTNGAPKHIKVKVKEQAPLSDKLPLNNFNSNDKAALNNKLGSNGEEIEKEGSLKAAYTALLQDINVCSKRGLVERFDSTIGSGTVLMPFGGRTQRTPIQAMVNLISDESRTSETCSVMSYGFDPFISEENQFLGAYYAVIESVCKLAATGVGLNDTYLTFQEYFERLGGHSSKWGKPAASLLGALKAQMDLEVAAIGGKDSMSGSFENLNVPPTLVSFAVTTGRAEGVISPEFKEVNHKIIMITPERLEDGTLDRASLLEVLSLVQSLSESKRAKAIYSLGSRGIAEALYKMALGNEIGFRLSEELVLDRLFSFSVGSFIIELADNKEVCQGKYSLEYIGDTTAEYKIIFKGESIDIAELDKIYEAKLERIYPMTVGENAQKVFTKEYKTAKGFTSAMKTSKPRVLIPVFPGTNCEYDSAKAFEAAGAESDIFVIKNLSGDDIKSSIEEFAARASESQIIFIPGGFSGGDEPDGSGKFITSFFRNQEISQQVEELLYKRDGLMAGICNGFQALIKLGLVPYGHILDINEAMPSLTYNTIGRHQSKLVRTKVVSNNSPWLSELEVGKIYTVPISHGEGRFIATKEKLEEMWNNGQIATQYVDLNGNPTMDIQYNPNGSVDAIEGILSPDGRILGKMAHSERIGKNLYRNVYGEFDMKLFEAAVKYFK